MRAFKIIYRSDKMGIIFDEKMKRFHLQGGNTSYIMEISEDGHLAHLYWGKKLRRSDSRELLKLRERCSFSPNVYEASNSGLSLDTLPQEYPAYGNTDFRMPAYAIGHENGSTISDLRYEEHKILHGKSKLIGLPSIYCEQGDNVATLEITLKDKVSGLIAVLSYSVYEEYSVIARSVCFKNDGKEELELQRALSMSVDFGHKDFDLLQLSGAWARERHIERNSLRSGNNSIESRRGASSHNNNPFIALLSKDATEDFGEAYGFNLVYSGNFLASAEVDQYCTTRISMGINPFDFKWLLTPGESFQTPEAVLVYSNEGIGGMSRTYHKLYRTRLCRGEYRDKARPILVNNWEATYFNFNAEKIENIAKAGSELGIELFVLDDGWFGKRNDDKSSLGDWFVDKNKLPGGIKDLAERVNRIGLKFGLWFEPEMISPDSELYRNHPDWCLHVPGRPRSEGRNQLILDLCRPEVCEYIIDTVSEILSNAPIDYVKWDMNRNMTEIGTLSLPPERQRETAHRYMLGLYKILESITAAFPNVLFESCSGGGGRFDGGMLYYMPQTWTSDDSDAIERLKIQYGTSIVYPSSTMGAHVSAIPNHQVGRNTPLSTRGAVAMSGNFGYELDLTKFTAEEKEIAKKQVLECKALRKLIQFGDMYRLLNPFKENAAAWMFVSEDKNEAFLVYTRVLATPNAPIERLRLKGLNPELDYLLVDSKVCIGGDELMYNGLVIPELSGDFMSLTYKLEAVL